MLLYELMELIKEYQALEDIEGSHGWEETSDYTRLAELRDMEIFKR